MQRSLIVIHDLNFATLSLNLGFVLRSKIAMTRVKQFYSQRYNFQFLSHKCVENTLSTYNCSSFFGLGFKYLLLVFPGDKYCVRWTFFLNQYKTYMVVGPRPSFPKSSRFGSIEKQKRKRKRNAINLVTVLSFGGCYYY